MKKPLRRQRTLNRPYYIVNLSLAGIIMMVFIYSGLFSAKEDNHPVPSFYEKITGELAPSSGLSSAFSEIVRGNLDAARGYNRDSLLIFSFFLIQFMQRIFVTLLLYKQIPRMHYLFSADLAISILLFLFCFKGQLLAIGKLIFA
jgi:hypothetical protein